MQAEILSVGTELLLGEIADSNAEYISQRLKESGVDVYRRVTIGDNLARLSGAFKEAMERADIVIATGGLGPTSDDLTAQALASATGRRLLFHAGAWESIAKRFQRLGRDPSESQRKQALIVEGGSFFGNPEGTAPGQFIFCEGKLAALLPGPPREMAPMFENSLMPLIKQQFPSLIPLWSKNLRLAGLPEASVGEMLGDLMESSNPSVAPYAGLGEVRLRIAARGKDPEETCRIGQAMEMRVRERLKDYIYGENQETLEEACGHLLARGGWTLAVSESVTGGLVSHRLTQVPGSSRYFKMGIVAYHPSVKSTVLGLARDTVVKHQAVNPEVAGAMAANVSALAGTKIGLSTTGFAGPEGGTSEEPVGTVYTGLSHPGGTILDRRTFSGSRARVKEYAAGRALYVLWDFLKRNRS